MKNTQKQTKYDKNYVGPYEIIVITGENSVKLKRKNKIIRAHKDQLKRFKDKQSKEEMDEATDPEVSDGEK